MRSGRDYIAGVRRAYCGELAASQVYGLLAEQRSGAGEKAKLAAIAAVEARTAAVLMPIAVRLGIACDMHDLSETVRRRVGELRALTWTQLIDQALASWPPYIAEFEALARDAPAGDAGAMEFLVAHERALVAFLRIEVSRPQALDSIAPLEALLERAPGAAS